MDNDIVKNALMRVYKILGLSEDEANQSWDDLVGVRQVAVVSELVKSMDEEEIGLANELMQNGDEAKITMIKKIIAGKENNNELIEKSQVAAERVLKDHILYLKTQGTETQKAEIAAILANI